MPTEPNVDWTIMLYIAADDVLANFAVESLRQLYESATASTPSGANVVVAAQFAYSTAVPEPTSENAEETPGKNLEGLYIFKQDPDKMGEATSVPKLAKLVKPNADAVPKTSKTAGTVRAQKTVDISQKDALTTFMKRVYDDDDLGCKAKHYALILWGHGPELLLQPSAGSLTTGGSDSMYITPKELREALASLNRPKKLDIIGFDACYMSMFEMAYELRGQVKYMVASQEEVPDASFPYDKLVELFRKAGKLGKDDESGNDAKLESLLETGAKEYVTAYQDCICGDGTGMKPVTLSLLNLKNYAPLQSAVLSLTNALVAATDEGLANLLIEARERSQDYASGLYVDLDSFCENLTALTSRFAKECTNVKTALKEGPSSLILKNEAVDNERSHGISIYFPYLNDPQYAQVSRPLVKGGDKTHGGKGFGEAINGAATEYLMCARRSLILDTEKDYEGLELNKGTHWYSFITDVWTNALVKMVPADLDFHYSAQQSWMNLRRGPINNA
jgi:hypothetical protein